MLNRVSTLSYGVRASLGYDGVTLAALDVSAEDHFAIAFEAMDFCRVHAEVLEPLVQARFDALSTLGDPSVAESEEASAEAVADLLEAHTGILLAAFELGQDCQERLDPAAQSSQAAAVANAELDPLVRLIPLTAEQRSELWEASVVLHSATQNPYVQHRDSLIAQARLEFESSLENILSPEQLADLEMYRSRLAENLPIVAEQEREAMEAAAAQARGPMPNTFLAAWARALQQGTSKAQSFLGRFLPVAGARSSLSLPGDGPDSGAFDARLTPGHTEPVP